MDIYVHVYIIGAFVSPGLQSASVHVSLLAYRCRYRHRRKYRYRHRSGSGSRYMDLDTYVFMSIYPDV